MRVLVTGAAGFIGSHTVERLLADGHDVMGIDDFSPSYDPAIKQRNLADAMSHERFRLVVGDITDAAALASAWGERVDAVVHLAARAGVRASVDEPLDYEHTNLRGSMMLLEAARRQSEPPRMVLASSSSVYGGRTSGPFVETDDCDAPISPYAVTKRSMELLCHTWHHLHGLDICCLRFFTVYGPRQRPDLAITRFATAAVGDGRIKLFGDGSSARDYTYVDDIVEGVVRALDRARGLEVVNVGNGSPVTLDALVHEVERVSGRTLEAARLPERPGDAPITHSDNRHADAVLGAWPRVGFAEGMDRFWAWFER